MATQTTTKKQGATLDQIATQLRDIQYKLGKLLLVVPEESLKEYKNASSIKKAYLRALKKFPAA